MSDPSPASIVPPRQLDGSSEPLHPESTLRDLPLYQFQIDLSQPGHTLADIFERYPLLPGAVLTDQKQFAGFISRQRLLEFLLRPEGLELFLAKPLRVLRSYARCPMLSLPGHTPILQAAHQALRRSPELLGEPLLVWVPPANPYLLDIHTLHIAYWQLRGVETQMRYERTQAEMIQSDKMANLGRLVDGVAHEILDPISFIWGNLSHVKEYCQDLLGLLAAYEQALPDPPPPLQQQRDRVELDFLRDDLPRTVESIRAGSERLSKLAGSLQNFCHIDAVYPKPADLHELLDSILFLLKSRLSSEIQVVRNYGHLPPVSCFAGQLNQVFMNLLTYAVDSLLNWAVTQQWEDDAQPAMTANVATGSARPTLTITTEVRSQPTTDNPQARWVVVRIADNGPALAPEEQAQILQSFSLKQRAAKETSLSVSYQIVTAKHGGQMTLRSPLENPNPVKNSPDFPKLPSADVNPLEISGKEFEILLPLI